MSHSIQSWKEILFHAGGTTRPRSHWKGYLGYGTQNPNVGFDKVHPFPVKKRICKELVMSLGIFPQKIILKYLTNFAFLNQQNHIFTTEKGQAVTDVSLTLQWYTLNRLLVRI